ncbi:MAG: amidohydrolase family protein [Deltaproteobacteria bacterium]|nr:amidohydrolase family protein [Deltaproteobacteria bacterium]
MAGSGLVVATGLCSSRASRAQPAAPFIADVHCHTFNAHDIPIEGFLQGLATGHGVPRFIVDLLKDPIAKLAQTAWSLAPDAAAEMLILSGLLGGGTPPAPASSKALAAPTHDELISAAAARARKLAPVSKVKHHPELKALLAAEELDDGDLLGAVLQAQAKDDPELAAWLTANGAPKAKPFRLPAPGAADFEKSFLVWSGGDSKGWLETAFDSVLEGLLGAVRFISRVATSRLEITRQLATVAPEISLFTPALVDFNIWAAGQSAHSSIAQQVEMQGTLSHLHALGKILPGNRAVSFHGYVPFNPYAESPNPRYAAIGGDPEDEFRRWDADAPRLDGGPFDVVRAAIQEHGFIGVKIYPPNGFTVWNNAGLPSSHPLQRDTRRLIDLALRRLYRWCDEQRVPVLVHTGSSNLFAKQFAEFSRPDRWEPVLDRFKALHVCLGHFGGTSKSKVGDEGRYWVDLAGDLAHKYQDRVWFDISDAQSPLPSQQMTRLVAALQRPGRDLRRHLIYGTDFFMNDLVTDPGEYLRSVANQLGTDALFKDLGPEFPSWFFGDNAMAFLGLRNSSDGSIPEGSAPGNRKRLLAWYQGKGAPVPKWL